MPKLTIDNQTVEVAAGKTVLDAARQLGIDIPALCYLDGCSPNTSCMACVVRLSGPGGRNSLAPSCATPAVDGMVVESETHEVRAARKTALELLLGDHAGDCISPCQGACPAHMDISQMIRQIAIGDLGAAIATVKRDIPLPAVLGRICPAPCEPGCRRAAAGGPVAICMLKQYVADVDLATAKPYLPERAPSTGKAVAVVGAGPAGLAAAYYLLASGHNVTILDQHEQAGGALRHSVDPARLPAAVLEGEIDVIRRLGGQFRLRTMLGRDVAMERLRQDFDAVVIAAGTLDKVAVGAMGLEASNVGLRVDKNTWRTSLPDVFAAGGAVRPSKIAVRSVAEGKAAAVCVDQFLRGLPLMAPGPTFTTRLGKLGLEELQPFMLDASAAPRTEAGETGHPELTADQALGEALRCLHCECAAEDDCKLRRYATAYEADPRRYHGPVARPISPRIEHPFVRYEPGKCISCGLCVQIAGREGEELGLSFIGRGFNVRVGVPFDSTIAQGLQRCAGLCASACPTGAITMRLDVAAPAGVAT